MEASGVTKLALEGSDDAHGELFRRARDTSSAITVDSNVVRHKPALSKRMRGKHGTFCQGEHNAPILFVNAKIRTKKCGSEHVVDAMRSIAIPSERGERPPGKQF